MKCPRCGNELPERTSACPVCAGKEADAGVFKTSSVLISTGGAPRAYHSVDEVPAELREALEQSTQGENAATIVFADPRGRGEIGESVRSLPPNVARRLENAAAVGKAPGPAWLTPLRRKLILGGILALTLLFLVAVFSFARRL